MAKELLDFFTSRGTICKNYTGKGLQPQAYLIYKSVLTHIFICFFKVSFVTGHYFMAFSFSDPDFKYKFQ